MRCTTACFSALFVLFAGGLSAQITGDVKGVVTDPSGATVARAKLTLTSTETGQSRMQSSDGAGRFTFDQLRVGDYELKVELSGFRTAASVARVRSGET